MTALASDAPHRAWIFAALLGVSACGGGGGGSGGGSPPRGNQPPTAADACVAVPSASATLSGRLPGSDPDGNALIYEILDYPLNGSLSTDPSGNYTYTPYANARGMDRFTYRVSDPSGLVSDVGTMALLVDGSLRIMPLGDSITAGFMPGLPESQYVGYRRKLHSDLSALGLPVDFVGSVAHQGGSANPPLADRDHEGHDGWCDDNTPYCTVSSGRTIADNIAGFLDANPPDIVLLHIGTNHFDTNSAGVERILDGINAWAEGHYRVSVFVARIIPTLDGSLDVTTFNQNVANVAFDRSRTRIWLVDQQSQLSLPDDGNRADPRWMTDDLHPNQTGYDRLADRWRLDLVSSGALPTCD
ncbi:Ig-like domain-containing protein [Sulfurifustis variabilis]|uniref:Ig-like domain-containing protein n=1 Tax=Sulfurifustis variabilis TaxID=1675686 RepID=UPI0022B258AE|nr:Ig-like domain-containing protein [Sulfurifustis variabilis]